MVTRCGNNMQSLLRFSSSSSSSTLLHLSPISSLLSLRNPRRSNSTQPQNGSDEWNEAWESSWIPEDFIVKNRAPWESDVNFDQKNTTPSEIDSETKAFVEEMNDNWNERSRASKKPGKFSSAVSRFSGEVPVSESENLKRDYRVKKQEIHAGLWMKEIEKMKEAELGDSKGGDDIERLLDSCSEIFDTSNNGFNDSKIPSTSEFKTKPDGWETTSKAQEGNLWEISQREEDILMQEFERRIAYSKFQIASFIKSHIFSRRRPIDGWKYMIEELGPNARKGKGSVSRLPSLSDVSTQPFKEEKIPMRSTKPTPYKGRTGRRRLSGAPRPDEAGSPKARPRQNGAQTRVGFVARSTPVFSVRHNSSRVARNCLLKLPTSNGHNF